MAFDVVGRRLFKLASNPVTFGRFVVLGTLGRGGMGTVLKAYDESLDRAIAIKLLHSGTHERDVQRLRREAQALAKLSHPNVVHVYEVGKADGKWFIAMELVAGQTLRKWNEGDHGWRERVKAYLLAGSGLAAAHAAGLVHRDFKPDNCIIDEQGRPRVLDFGLAREAIVPSAAEASTEASASDGTRTSLTQTGAVLGTLGYMPPEQLDGKPADARSDQFSFCVALYEALYGERPFAGKTRAELFENITAGHMHEAPKDGKVPAWVRAVLVRGLSAAPAERFASMNALLAALEADPSRRNRRLILAGAGVAAVVLVAGGYAADHAHRVQACEDEAASISSVWNDAARARVEASLLGTGVGFASSTWERVEPVLDEYAVTWSEIRESTCVAAEVEGTRSEDLAVRTSECLAEHRDALEVFVDVLADADTVVVGRAVLAALKLPPLEECTDDARLGRRMQLPADAEVREQVSVVRRKLTRAEGLGESGRYADGLALAREAESDAESIGWAPLQAEALGRVGDLTSDLGEFEPAEQVLERAVDLAMREGHEEVAFEAMRDLCYTTGHARARHERGLWWGNMGLSLAARLGDGDDARTALVLHSIATIHVATGAYAEAKRVQDRSVAILEEELGPDHPYVAASLDNLATSQHKMGAYAEAKALHDRALAIREKALGPDHPEIGYSLHNVALSHWQSGAYSEARPLLERALAVLEKALGPDHPSVATGLHSLASTNMEMGAYAEAKPLLERSLAIREKAFGSDHPKVAWSLHNLAGLFFAQGALAEAKANDERALAILEKALGPDHPDLALALTSLASVHNELGAYAEAKPLLERAVAIREKALGPDHPDLALSLNTLASALISEAAHAEAKPLLERALTIQEKALGPDHPDLGLGLDNLAIVHIGTGKHAEAKPLLERTLAIREKALGPDHPKLARSLVGLAEVALAQDRSVEAVPLAERAVALYETDTPQTSELPRARFVLARAMLAAGHDHDRARTLAEQARDGYREAALPRYQAEVEAWLVAHRRELAEKK